MRAPDDDVLHVWHRTAYYQAARARQTRRHTRATQKFWRGARVDICNRPVIESQG